MQDLVDGGIPADAVASRVLDAVRTDTFYILTHPELNEAIAERGATSWRDVRRSPGVIA